MRTRLFSACLGLVLVLAASGVASAHFGMVIPSASTISEQADGAAFNLTLSFSHPMEMVGMPMDKPAALTVVRDGKHTNLLSALKPATVLGQKAWQATYPLRRPGVYQFVMEPAPYWEPAEDCYIVHYTKLIVPAFGMEDGWDEPVGVKTEIVPLTRPFGLYAGCVFQGRVLVDGKPVPGALVEIEYYNKAKTFKAPNDYLVTATVRADQNGVFTAGVPFAGWWGFAALTEAKEKRAHHGTPKSVEQGAVLWIEAVNPERVK